MSAIVLDGLRKDYGSVNVIRRVDLSIASGEFVVLVGPSGCGKSTLLRMIAGLEEISGGQLSIGGRAVGHLPPAERNIAMVFQDYALYPHMSVEENMGFGLKMRDADKDGIDAKVKGAAGILKIEPFLDRRPAQLSGGQRQRVAMGRAIVREPDAFLFDEPLSNLDAALRVEMRLEIARLHRRMKATTVYVTHDQTEAMTLADRIVVMNGGHMEQVGPPLELYHRPKTLFVARFIGSPTMNTLDCGAPIVGPGALRLRLPQREIQLPLALASPAPERLTLGIRPEDLRLSSLEEAWFTGELAMVERLGSQTFGYLEAGGERPITVEFPRDSSVQVGERLSVAGDPARAHLFDSATGQRVEATAMATV
ncbi:ABC transporter [Aureimonas ureilytica]|uniref:ABC transporter n=1 Tax=Aureimonas ureilytica TaxID=401562 RepID=A0A175RVZ8_9HYPH|nr:sn-glycerol-3-phosphate ABC transporter ATP-binding protein UgpC [Aureimonas ureilytica]KTR07816.1 ABC transporter [Aureimonas ureilytica]